jgi:hypothetical protein
MADLSVFYNNVEITPTPLVNQNYQFLDYGSRWGSSVGIELQGFITGITSTGACSRLNTWFSGNFGKLEVKEGSTVLYQWSGVYVDEMSIQQWHYKSGTSVPYSVKIRTYSVPSGVIDPSNEYVFTQGDDGIGTLNHNIAAHGIKNSIGAFQNAVNFVKNFTGKVSFGPSLFPSGGLVMMSLSESINRAEGLYSVNEVYKFNTGSPPTQVYLEWFSASASDVIDNEYITVDAQLKLQGNAVNNNLYALEPVAQAYNFQAKLEELGFATGKFIFNTDSINRNSGMATVEIRKSYLSGTNTSDITGYFDYTINYERDIVLPKDTWRLDGEFICKGPIDYRKTRLAAFKATVWPNVRGYLLNLISGSDVYNTFHTYDISTGNHSTVNVQENSGMASLKLSLTTLDGKWDDSINNPRYSVEVQPPKWSYDLLPSANIEGHYVIQDHQMLTQGKVNASLACESFVPSEAIQVLSGYMNDLEDIYLQTGIIMAESISTGFTDCSYNKEWLGVDEMSSGLAATKVYGAMSTDYVRQPGYKFGY